MLYFHKAPIFNKSADDLLQLCLERIKEAKYTSFIATPNPEMYVEAVHNKAFRSVLQNTSFNIIDGFGLYLGLRLFGFKVQRLTGTDLVESLLTNSRASFYLLGGAKGNAKLIQQKFPKARIVGHFDGAVNAKSTQKILSQINELKPQVVLVALGAVKQEKWILDNLTDLQASKLLIACGGALDYLSNKVTRAPRFLRNLGLEWLYRLLRQPKRIFRIFKAVVVFPIVFFLVELVCFLYRIVQAAYTKCK